MSLQKDQLKLQIETLRSELNEIYNDFEEITNAVLDKSQELDIKLNEYNRLQQSKKECKIV